MLLLDEGNGEADIERERSSEMVLDIKMPILGGEAPNARVLQNFSFIVTSINGKTDLSYIESNRVNAGFCNELEVFICQVSFAYLGLTLFGPTGIIYDLIQPIPIDSC